MNPPSPHSNERRQILMLAGACALLVANLYLSQTLVGPIGETLGMSEERRGLIVTLTQLGYCSGLLLLVPLADLLENRSLAVFLALGCSVSLLLGAAASNLTLFLLASYLIGLCATGVQVLVPLAAHLSAPQRQGRAVGQVMSGLMFGIMMARPAASAVAQGFGWRAVFALSSATALLTAVLLWKLLPPRVPQQKHRYLSLLTSMAKLYVGTPILLQRALYQGFLFASFSAFWTAVPLYLSSPALHLNQGEIALFSLIGVTGVVAAPIAGTLADQGRLFGVTVVAMLIVAISFGLTLLPCEGHSELLLLVVAAVGIDFGATANLVVSQREIFRLGDEVRGRLNGLFISTFFLGGAAGSALGAWAYARGGWDFTALTGSALPILALLAFFSIEAGKRHLFPPKPEGIVKNT